MCGIAGFFGHRTPPPHALRAMEEALYRRGPDAQQWIGWDASWRVVASGAQRAMLATRLAIRDPRPVANQPMQAPGAGIWLCYNGEVYGWEDHVAELEAKTGPFHTRSDTEFILRGYQAWGLEGLLPRLRGMFALAILDLSAGCLWLVRDRLGLKPLLYYHDAAGRELAFGSLVRSVLPYLPADRRSFSAGGIDAYLAHRYIPAPLTAFEHVRRLENGHWLRFDLASGELKKQRYWDPRPLPGDARQVLDDAVRLRTASDRPVGLFLSSGIDSTAIACRLAALGYRNIETFTAAFPGSELDESPLAAETAQALGMPHRRIVVPTRIREDFEALVADLDEPFADPSSIPTWYLSRETTKHVKVALGGDGGDELFGGYKRYAKHVRMAGRRGLALEALRPRPSLQRRGLGKLRLELAMSWEDSYALRFSGFNPLQRAALQPDARVRDTYWRHEGPLPREAQAALFEIDRHNYLPEYILRKADLMTMAHGLEGRAPLLDHVFFQHVLALPQAERFTAPPKAFFDRSLAPLDAAALRARKKRGFNPPLRQWLEEDLAERTAGLPEALASASGGQLDAAVLREAVAHAKADSSWAELVLQLLFLEASLRQLRGLAKP